MFIYIYIYIYIYIEQVQKCVDGIDVCRFSTGYSHCQHEYINTTRKQRLIYIIIHGCYFITQIEPLIPYMVYHTR